MNKTTNFYVSNTDIALKAIHEIPYGFIPTGSRVYTNNYEESSDYDFIVNPNFTWMQGQILKALLMSWNYGVFPEVEQTYTNINTSYDTDDDKNSIVYLTSHNQNSIKINLIFLDNINEYYQWVLTTEAMIDIKNHGAIDAIRLENKESRVLAFRTLKLFIKNQMQFDIINRKSIDYEGIIYKINEHYHSVKREVMEKLND